MTDIYSKVKADITRRVEYWKNQGYTIISTEEYAKPSATKLGEKVFLYNIPPEKWYQENRTQVTNIKDAHMNSMIHEYGHLLDFIMGKEESVAVDELNTHGFLDAYYKWLNHTPPEDIQQWNNRQESDEGGKLPELFPNEDAEEVFQKAKKDGEELFEKDQKEQYLPSITDGGISPDVNQKWKWVFGIRRYDPLVLDLDGDGIETVSDTQGITFDFDGDGHRTGTGWIKQDDGILVFDRNKNGKIDNGSELFGDGTVKKDGTLAKDGFDALRDLDTNEDGIFDANDADFDKVKVWQDLNQDGIAQANELKTLAEHGISGIVLDSTASGKKNNDNIIVSEGTFIREDGSTGKTGSLDLSSNPFYREYGDKVELTERTEQLPEMKGSGAVRDLQEAATINDNLATTLEEYSQLQTREQQWAEVDKVIFEWAVSSGFKTFDERVEDLNTNLLKFKFCYSWEKPTGNVIEGGPSNIIGGEEAPDRPTAADLALKSMIEKLKILEIFNGQNFFNFERDEKDKVNVFLAGTGEKAKGSAGGSIPMGPIYITEEDLNLSLAQKNGIEAAYQALRESIYEGLVAQTRLSHYLDDIELVLTEEGNISFDYSKVLDKLTTLSKADPINAIIDSFELMKSVSFFENAEEFEKILNGTLNQLTEEQLGTLKNQLGHNKFQQNNKITGSIEDDILIGNLGHDTLNGGLGNDKLFGGRGNDYIAGGDGNDSLYGGEGNDSLYGGNGNDLLFGGEGNDRLIGDAGNDTLDGGDGNDILEGGAGHDLLIGGAGNDNLNGGEGNDTLRGGTGNDYLAGNWGDDTYIFRRGDGNDTIAEVGAGNDTIIFEDINSDDLIGLEAKGLDLIIYYGEGDQITIKNHFYNTTSSKVDNYQFADGVTFSLGELYQYYPVQIVQGGSYYFPEGTVNLNGSAGNDYLRGGSGNDYMQGNEGNDRLIGEGGNDILDGGDGNDTLEGGAGHDLLIGGAGNDSLDGGADNDTLRGGTGNDYLGGGRGDDTYIFRRGDGNDTIGELSNGNDTIIFEDINSDDLIGLEAKGQDLIIYYGEGDQITIKNHFYNGTDYKVDNYQFADGVILSLGELFQHYPVQIDQGGNYYFPEGAVNLNGSAGNDYLRGGSGNDYMQGNEGNDRLIGEGGNDTLDGGDGNDTLEGGVGHDLLIGGAGNDNLDGGADNDTLRGGTGNDYLGGGRGDDTYIFRKGDGIDTIMEIDGNDTIIFEDISSDELVGISAKGEDLILYYGENDQITIRLHFSSNSRWIDIYQFADGVSLSLNELLQTYPVRLDQTGGYSFGNNANVHILGSEGNDYITGSKTNDTLDGGEGNDTLNGGAGNDLLLGGAGNDSIKGDWGNDTLRGGIGNDSLDGGGDNDTYIFRKGDGIDTIYDFRGDDTIIFEDVLSTEIRGLEGVGNDLIIHYGDNDQIIINNYFRYTDWKIEHYQFADGVTFSLGELFEHYPVQIAQGGSYSFTDGSVTVNGSEGNDTLSGGSGNDYLKGNEGNDRLIGNAGNDTLDGGEGNDTLDGGAGHDLLLGGAGNDSIKGDWGNDTLRGGIGNDSLDGGGDNDTYIFRKGDGIDTIYDFRGDDTIIFEDVLSTEIRGLEGVGNDLIIHYGDNDQIIINNHFRYTDWKIEHYQFADDVTLSLNQLLEAYPLNTMVNTNSSLSINSLDIGLYNAQTDNLINAMAAFAAPVGVETNTLDEQINKLDSIVSVGV